MLLHEIMGLGDENVLGRLINDATNTLKTLQKQSNKEIRSLASGLLNTLDNLESNPNIIRVDQYSLTQLLQMIATPTIDIRTLRMVSDAFGSYNDNSTD
jgi:uncharacterized phage infection (PIP) family protein YhgE